MDLRLFSVRIFPSFNTKCFIQEVPLTQLLSLEPAASKNAPGVLGRLPLKRETELGWRRQSRQDPRISPLANLFAVENEDNGVGQRKIDPGLVSIQ